MYSQYNQLVTMGWDIGSFLSNAAKQLKFWGGLAIVIFGIIGVFAGAYMIIKGLVMHGKAQVSWAVAIALLIVGGAFGVGGWSFVSSIASGGGKTISDLGGGNVSNDSNTSTFSDSSQTIDFGTFNVNFE